LAWHFRKYIKNSITEDLPSSQISNLIVTVIDTTIHPIRRPQMDQYLFWNDHYQTHGIKNLLLVDYDANIISVETGIPGKMHDSTIASLSLNFKNILKKRYTLGDPGFYGVCYVVSGLKTNMINCEADLKFDSITRSEQIIIEHVNGFLKKFEVLSKQSVFIHDPKLLSGCVLLLCGWYNWIKIIFDKY